MTDTRPAKPSTPPAALRIARNGVRPIPPVGDARTPAAPPSGAPSPRAARMPAASAPELPLCARCEAVCCRLTVVLQPEDRVPAHLTTRTPAGLRVMARNAQGWCAAIDATRMCCSIYENRPDVCRRFVMSGPYCRDVREDYRTRTAGRSAAAVPAAKGLAPSATASPAASTDIPHDAGRPAKGTEPDEHQ